MPTYGPTSQARPSSDPRRRLPYSQPSLCVRVQRESECKRPKQTFKASWVGGKGEGMVRLLGEKADTLEKPSRLGFSTMSVRPYYPNIPGQTSRPCAVGPSRAPTTPVCPVTPGPGLGSRGQELLAGPRGLRLLYGVGAEAGAPHNLEAGALA